MKKHLLRGTLLLSSTFVLVACSSQPDSDQTVEEVTTVIEETTEEQEESSELEATSEETKEETKEETEEETKEESKEESKDESKESKESEKSKESEETEEESKEETKEETKEESKESEETEEESKKSSEDSDETSSEETLVLNQHELAEFDGQGDNKAYIAVNDVIYDVTDQEIKDGYYGDYKVGVNTLYNVLLLGEDEALKDLPIVGVLEMVEETEEPAEEAAEEDSQDENEDLPAINQEELAEFDGQDGRKAYIGVNDVIYDVTDQELKDGYYGDYKVGVNTLYNSLLLGEDESLKDLPVVGSFEKLVASEEEEVVEETEESEEKVAQPLQDGIYTVTSSPNSKDEVIEQMITAEEGKITEAAFKVLHGEEEVALDEAEAQIVETLTKQFVDQGELLLPSEEGTPFIAYQLIANSEILRTLAQQGMSETINLDEVEMKDSEYVVKDSFYEVTLKVENNEVKALEISPVSNEDNAEIVEKFIEEFMGVETLDELTYVAAEGEDEETAQRNQAIYEHLKGLVNYAINLSKVQTIIDHGEPVEEVEESSEESEKESEEESEETSAEESSEEETSEE